MASRLKLHQRLKDLLSELGEPQNVYYQPPESIRLEYPCIVYKRNGAVTTFANNKPYTFKPSYEVKVIDRDPDSPIVRAIGMSFPESRFNRHFTVDNLNHDVFIIYWHNDSKEE